MLYIEESGRQYGVEIVYIDSSLVEDVTFADALAQRTIGGAEFEVVVWHKADPGTGLLMKGERIRGATSSPTPLAEIENHIRASIVAHNWK